jgi:rhomboid protease GluP
VCAPQGGVLALPYKWQWRLDKFKDSMRGLFGGEQQPRPRICPVCNTLVGITSSRCHECGTNLNFSLAALSKQLGGIVGEHAPVTTVLLVANVILVGVSLVFTMQNGEAGGLKTLFNVSPVGSYRLGATFPISIFFLNEWWRLVTAMFLHGGLLHIGFNMMALMQFGPALEEVYGSPRFLFVYVFTGAFGFLASALRGHFSLGASGALLGVMGAILAITTKRGGAYMQELRSRLIGSLLFLFVFGIWGPMGIDNWAHGGGLVAGFAIGKWFADREPVNNEEKKRAQLLGWLAGIVVIVCFVFMLIHFRDPTPFDRMGLRKAPPRPAVERSVSSENRDATRYNAESL